MIIICSNYVGFSEYKIIYDNENNLVIRYVQTSIDDVEDLGVVWTELPFVRLNRVLETAGLNPERDVNRVQYPDRHMLGHPKLLRF